MAGIAERLRCVSVHSVKGGVGKSTLSYALALALAREEPTLLVDVDLTGTSLADVLTLEAPSWSGEMDLRRAPDGWLPWPEARRRVGVRAHTLEGHPVPFLNDFLLWREGRSQLEEDVHPAALAWRLSPEAAPDARLYVIPSSALPRDLAKILPVIYDELHAGYLEGRLEWLLEYVLSRTSIRTVVFDTPPTIPGLSRALLSMALRLPKDQDLAEEGGTPPNLKRAMAAGGVVWTPLLVVTADHQDLGAAERWLTDRDLDEIDAIKVVLNRADEDRGSLLYRLRWALAHGVERPPQTSDLGLMALEAEDYQGVLLDKSRDPSHLAVVRQQGALALFRPSLDRAEAAPPDLSEVLALLRGKAP